MNYDFAFRVNMGEEIGSGHIIRCIAIARKLKKHKQKIIFLVNDKNKFLKYNDHIKFPFKVVTGYNEKNRIAYCKKIKNIKTMIIDLGNHNQEYSKKLKEIKTAIIDDRGNKEIFSSLLINGTIVKKFQKYKIQNVNTISLIGGKFMIIREEFLKNKKRVKISKNPIKKILLTFGGTDDYDFTSKILLLLKNTEYTITVIIGPSNKNIEKIKKISNVNKNIKIVQNPNNIGKIFAEQDLILTSSGITIYELAFLGVPCIMFPASDLQKKNSIEMEKLGFGRNYGSGEIRSKKIFKVLTEFENFKLRKKMNLNGRKIIDGNGIKRITKQLLKLN